MQKEFTAATVTVMAAGLVIVVRVMRDYQEILRQQKEQQEAVENLKQAIITALKVDKVVDWLSKKLKSLGKK